jgi:hypothetical protein
MGAVGARLHLRSRKRLVVGAVVVALALGGGAAGAILSLTGGGGNDGLTQASFPGFQLSFRYPPDWKRKNWCWIGTTVFPLTLLTTAPAVPPCEPNNQFGEGTPLPPPQRLGRDDVTAWWFASSRAIPAGLQSNASVDGRATRISVRQEPTRRTSSSYVNCRNGKTQRFLTAQIEGSSDTRVKQIQLGAVICGPHFAAGEAAVRQMLDSVRFTD